MSRLVAAAALGLTCSLAACSGGAGGGEGGAGGAGPGGSGGGSCAPPSDGLYATFDVEGETFSSQITSPTGVDEALALWAGASTAKIPNGALVCSPAPFNCPWSFHQDPATIEFADVTTEVCDGKPSYVDAHCTAFGARYCPWSAKLVELRDCRTDPACPPVPP